MTVDKRRTCAYRSGLNQTGLDQVTCLAIARSSQIPKAGESRGGERERERERETGGGNALLALPRGKDADAVFHLQVMEP